MPTPQRSFRIEDDLYEPALAKAKAKGEDLTLVVKRALRRYIATPAPKKG